MVGVANDTIFMVGVANHFILWKLQRCHLWAGLVRAEPGAGPQVVTSSSERPLTSPNPPPTGKWHLGLSCRTVSDLCHHPLNHGFHHFLGLPLGMMGDCAGAEPSEKRAGLERRLRGAGRALAAVAVAIAALAWGRGRGLAPACWAPWAAIALGAVAAIFEAGSYVVGGAVARYDCFLMRNATVTQQPLQLDHVTPLLLREAKDFLRR